MQHVESPSSVLRPATRAGRRASAVRVPRHALPPPAGAEATDAHALLQAAWVAPLRLFLDRGQLQHLYLRRGSVISVREGRLDLCSHIWVHDHDIGPRSLLLRGAVHPIHTTGHLQIRALDDTVLELVQAPSLWSSLWHRLAGPIGRSWS